MSFRIHNKRVMN